MIQVDRYKIEVYKDENAGSGLPVIYSYMEGDEGRKVWQKGGEHHPYVLITVDGGRWNADLSPWEASRVFRRGEDFAGNADVFLSDLSEKMIPEAEKVLGYEVEKRLIGGYSLAGLFALYAVHRTDLFCGCASVSGSLWFDRFAQYCMEHRPDPAVQAVYLSLGDAEHHTRNERMARVASCTQQIYERLLMLGLTTRFDINPGGHMEDPEGRTVKGFETLTAMLSSDK